MGTVHKNEGGAGFAVVEAVLVLVIVAGVIGAGAYVYSAHHKKSTDTEASVTNTSSTTQAVPLNGTTSSIDQLTQQDAQSEANVDKSADAQSQSAATSANAAASNVGGAYNENNL